MTNNVIDLFARGNQELFHSAFIAWLLDENGSHGLRDRFLREFIGRLPNGIAGRLIGSLQVLTEYRQGNLRFDILLKPNSNSGASFLGLVLENKVKSFGNSIQLDNYKKAGFDVVVIALLPETLDDEAKKNYTIIKYSDINHILGTLALDPANHHQFLVLEYQRFLEQTLSTYNSIELYCKGSISVSDFRNKLKTSISNSVVRDNDVRTYSYYYYYLLAKYIVPFASDLAFGTRTYRDAKRDNENTKWEFEKNLQGPPYMEALIYRPCNTPPWKLYDQLASIKTNEPVCIAPRIEVWLDLNKIVEANDPRRKVGTLMLGTWAPELKEALRTLQPYANKLTPKPRASRNFHCEDLTLSDIPFEKIVDRIRGALKLIFT